MAHQRYYMPFDYAVLKGAVPGWTGVFHANGNPAITTTEEEIWYGGGLTTRPTSAYVASVVSDDADDTAGENTGARAVLIEGLDENFDFVSALVATAGLTPVATTQTFRRVHRATAVSTGSSDTNEGNIDVSLNGQNQCRIQPSHTIGRASGLTTPYNKIFAFDHWAFYNDSNKDMDFHINVRNADIGDTASKIRIHSIHVPKGQQVSDRIIAFAPPKFDIWLSASAPSGTASNVSVNLEGYFVDDTQWSGSGAGAYGAVFAFTRSDGTSV